jgi:hypothetical protein
MAKSRKKPLPKLLKIAKGTAPAETGAPKVQRNGSVDA